MENQLQLTTGKLRLCMNFKNIFSDENFLELPLYLRNPLTKLRISTTNYKLKLEDTI